MKHFTATEAKNRFGELLEQSGQEPIAIQKNGRDCAVILSVEEFKRLVEASTIDSAFQASLKRSMDRWDKVYEALAK